MPISVMPIWTVERNLPGLLPSRIAVRAPLLPSGHRLQTRGARRYDGEFGHCEHAIEHDQRQDDDGVEPGKGEERVHWALCRLQIAPYIDARAQCHA